ncbi:hypothetical protein BJ165DRAFT_1611741 [Panaeolus papilionaceus]|nr:hypothetical protein BJ165DRAFT_1611741 [Panaeolus papilionaceus]
MTHQTKEGAFNTIAIGLVILSTLLTIWTLIMFGVNPYRNYVVMVFAIITIISNLYIIYLYTTQRRNPVFRLYESTQFTVLLVVLWLVLTGLSSHRVWVALRNDSLVFIGVNKDNVFHIVTLVAILAETVTMIVLATISIREMRKRRTSGEVTLELEDK